MNLSLECWDELYLDTTLVARVSTRTAGTIAFVDTDAGFTREVTLQRAIEERTDLPTNENPRFSRTKGSSSGTVTR